MASSQSSVKPVTRNSSVEELQGGADRIDAFLAGIGPDHPDRSAILKDKCVILLLKFEKSQDPKDAALAVQAGRYAVGALSPSDANSATAYSNLAAALSHHFRYSNKVEDIEEAMENGKLARDCLEPGSEGWKMVNGNLCEMTYQKGSHKRTPQTIDEAIAFLEQLGAPGTLQSRRESSRLGAIAALLVHRFEATGSMEHLERAVKTGYESIEKLEEGTWREDGYGCTLTALTAYYQATGHFNSLEEAMRISDLLLADLHDSQYDDETRASRLSTHGSILELKSKRFIEADPRMAVEMLDKAIESGRAALAILQLHGENRPLILSMISSWLGTKAKTSNDSKWADEGIDFLNSALGTNTGHSIDNATLHANLSRMWEIKYRIHRKATPDEMFQDILDKAIESGEKTVSTTKDDDRNLGERRKNLASMLLIKYNVTKDSERRPYVKEMFTKAAYTETATLPIRIPSALMVGVLHFEDGELAEANKLLQDAVGLLTASDIQAASAEDLQQTLREIPGLGNLAASVSLALGRPPFEALHSLESANCVIAGLTMGSRVEISELERQHPPLAKEYDDIRTRLVQATRQLKVSGSYKDANPLHQSLLQEMARKEDDIRHLRGFEQFQLPLDADQVMQLARDGPIVTINVSQLRSDAIIVTKDDIRSLHLPKMTHKELQDHASVFNRLGNTARRNAVRIPPKSTSKSSTDAALRWLWDVAVHPILGVTKLTESGRLWWITSGLAGRAPFHAAGNYAGDPDENAPARMRSSYISSFKALKYGRDKRPASVTRQGMLLVTMSTNPYPHRHLNTAFEEQAIEDVFKDKMLHLAHPDPETVLAKIPDYSFVHFACHGASIDSDPNKSGLLLVKDGKPADLTIADLDAVELKEGSVAYLSACSTAEHTDGKLAGEAIHLANSFQALGFQHVIGTMWGANDAAAGDVAKRFYKKLGIRGGHGEGESRLDVATALHEAVREYRMTCREQDGVLKWGPFVHVGI